MREDDREFFATVSRRKVDGAHSDAQGARDALQRIVPGQMSMAIVVELEAIEVEDQHAELLRIANGALDLGVDALAKCAKVRKVGQVVRPRVRA